MNIEFNPGAARKTKLSEHATRFLFGGVVTVITGLVAHRWGPWVGGLCLAFPAILPATLTLVKEHDGRKKACDDARGSRFGALGLVAFAIVVAVLATRVHPALVLLCAAVAWTATSLTAYALRAAHRRAKGDESRFESNARGSS